MRRQDFFHLLNPNQKNRPGVQAYFDQRPELQRIWVERATHPTHLETVVEWAVREGRPYLAVWAGDGSFSRVVQKLYEMDAMNRITLALIPAGTCNDFARYLGQRQWRSVVDGIDAGQARERRFDAGLLTHDHGTRIFFNNAGFGRKLAAIGQRRSNPIKDIYAFDEHYLRIEWKTSHGPASADMRAYLGIIFNAPYFNNGMFFSRNPDAADGRLEACFVPVLGRMDLLMRFIASRLGGSLQDASTVRVSASELTIHSSQLMHPQADGEPVNTTGVHDLTFRVIPGAVRLVWPDK